jgi:hypothetical protein
MRLDGHFAWYIIDRIDEGWLCMHRAPRRHFGTAPRLELFVVLSADTHQASVGDMNMTCCTYAASQRPYHSLEPRGNLLRALALGPPHLAQINVLGLLPLRLAVDLDLASSAAPHEPLR